MKIGMLLPTCEPNTFNKIFLPSVKNLIGAKDKLIFAINYQEPWIIDEILAANDCLENMGFEIRSEFNQYEKPAQGYIYFNKIRYDCATMVKDCGILALCDDDFQFINGADAMIENIIEKFTAEEKLGILQCNWLKPLLMIDNKICDPLRFAYFTSSGLFFRNIYEPTGILAFPDEALDKVGAGEEFIIGYTLAKYGYITKTQGNSKIRHLRELGSDRYSPHGWDKKEVVMNEINGISPYIFKLYNELKDQLSHNE